MCRHLPPRYGPIDPNQTTNVDAVLSEFKKARVITHEHAHWTEPEFVVVVWTLPEEGLKNLKGRSVHGINRCPWAFRLSRSPKS